MKLLLENWRKYTNEAYNYNDPAAITISEQEILDFLNEGLHEGVAGDAWTYTKAKMTQMKDKGIELSLIHI